MDRERIPVIGIDGPQKGGYGGQAGAALNKHKELLTTIKRYYSNAFTDQLKQDAMNLFLGEDRQPSPYGHHPPALCSFAVLYASSSSNILAALPYYDIAYQFITGRRSSATTATPSRTSSSRTP
jgi:hypothetical protein